MLSLKTMLQLDYYVNPQDCPHASRDNCIPTYLSIVIVDIKKYLWAPFYLLACNCVRVCLT
jgi:hypothetical protein